MSSIPIFRLQYEPWFRSEFNEQTAKIFDEAFLTNHSFVRQFESAFAQWSGSTHALATSSGTSALECIFRALNVRGREVIVPANTFVATAQAVRNAGGIPVVADIEPEYLGLSPRAVSERVSARTAAVAVVHAGGIISPAVLAVQQICKDAGIALIEDCAHAHGASLGKMRAGKFGLAAAYSFHVTKVMTTGEGGAAVTDDDAFRDLLLSTRQFGASSANSLLHERDGGNAKMSEMQALMGCLELKRVDARIAKRRQIAQRYQERLCGTQWRPYLPAPDSDCPYYKTILASPRPWSEVREYLRAHDIALTGGVYHYPLSKQPLFVSVEACPVSERFAQMHICPPCYPELSLQEADSVCDRLLEFG